MKSIMKYSHQLIIPLILLLIATGPLCSQNIGIGTNNPQEKLHVYDGNLLIQNSIPYLIFSDTTPSNGKAGMKFRYNTTELASIIYNIYYDYMHFCTDYGGTRPDLIVDGSGNVGIGTISPTQKLQIYGGDLEIRNSLPYLIFSDTTPSNGKAGIKFRYSTTELASIIYNIYYDYMHFCTDYGGTRPDLIVDGSGWIGMGTLDPVSRLHISEGDITVDDEYPWVIVNATTASTGDAGLSFKNNGSAKGWMYYSMDENLFRLSAGTSSTRNDIIVKSDGDVGIGTDTPMGELHIHGDTVADLYLTPNATGGSYDSQVMFAEDDDFTYGMKIRYDGNANQLRVFGKNGSDLFGPYLNINRDNGYIGIGTSNPATQLHFYHASGTSNGLSIQNSYDSDRWHYYVYTDNNLALFFNGDWKGSFDDVTGAYTYVSDRRLKKNIDLLEPILDKVLRLTPHRYNFNFQDNSDQKYFGFLAHEVAEIFPSLAHYQEESDLYSLDYSSFGVLAIKAIQEQQEIIDQQKEEIHELSAIVRELMARMEAVENN